MYVVVTTKFLIPTPNTSILSFWYLRNSLDTLVHLSFNLNRHHILTKLPKEEN
jgi:hypothetical protein